MAEIQEQRYICKICSKICASGKSLGGHMRVHMRQISASKKAEKQKAEIKIQDDEYDFALLSEESNPNFDQNLSYQLRENPKKSWRVSDPKRGASNSCRECGKKFPSLRAVSGHMRCHSNKNVVVEEVHHCEKCGKGFNSIRAMFGHMKSHSKKSKRPNETTTNESVSDFENLCTVRRKRSRIGYRTTESTSNQDLNASTSAVSELEETEAASCLIMLSRGVRYYLNFETESSDDACAYFGAESPSTSGKVPSGCDGDFLSDVKKPVCCSSGFVEPFAGKNDSEFDDLDSEFVDGDLKNAGTDQVSDVETEMEVDFDQVMKSEKSDDSRPSYTTKSAEFDEGFDTGKTEGCSKLVESNKDEKATSTVHESGFENNTSENEANLESTSEHGVSVELSKSKDYECLVCFKVFASGQALGGHKRAHYNGFTDTKKKEAMAMDQEAAEMQNVLDLNFPVAVDEGIKGDVGFKPWLIGATRETRGISAN